MSRSSLFLREIVIGRENGGISAKLIARAGTYLRLLIVIKFNIKGKSFNVWDRPARAKDTADRYITSLRPSQSITSLCPEEVSKRKKIPRSAMETKNTQGITRKNHKRACRGKSRNNRFGVQPKRKKKFTLLIVSVNQMVRVHHYFPTL